MSLTVEWKGAAYAVPETEPPQDRDAAGLHPIFRAQLELFVSVAQATLEDGLELRVGECRRTLERQCYLYALGRTLPGPKRSWTLDSRHRSGCAADLILVDLGADRESRADDVALWAEPLWREMYANVPPELFGLTPIVQEMVHLELGAADLLIARADTLGVTLT